MLWQPRSSKSIRVVAKVYVKQIFTVIICVSLSLSYLQRYFYRFIGVILVFLSGQEEIETVQGLLEEKLGKLNGKEHARQLLITPCFANLPYDEQQKIFQPTPTDFQKVVLATNIAETSLTIDSVEFVIDTGFFKQNEYDAESGIYNLVKQPITKVSEDNSSIFF